MDAIHLHLSSRTARRRAEIQRANPELSMSWLFECAINAVYAQMLEDGAIAGDVPRAG